MQNTTAYPGLTEKELNNARRTYRKVQNGRPKGFFFWLILAVVWLGFGFLVGSVGEASGGEDPTAALTAFFGIPAVPMVLFFFLGNSKSKKKYQKWCAEVSQMDPALTEMFRMELEHEKAEEKRLEQVQKEKDKEELEADMREMGQAVKDLGKLIIEDIKADIEDAWYDD